MRRHLVNIQHFLTYEEKRKLKMASNQSAFDPNMFLNQEIVGANETKYTAIPIGEYKAFIDDLGMRSHDNKPILEVTYAILDDRLRETLGMDKPTVKDGIFLDVAEDGVTLLFGINKNIKLGRLREACGQNDPKKKWNFNMLRTQGPLNILVEHNWKENKETGVRDGPFANVARVTRAS